MEKVKCTSADSAKSTIYPRGILFTMLKSLPFRLKLIHLESQSCHIKCHWKSLKAEKPLFYSRIDPYSSERIRNYRCSDIALFSHRHKNRAAQAGRPENYCSTFSLMCTSSSCFCSTVEGAPIIRSWAFLFMGKVMTSRMLSSPVSSMISRSTPGAAPAWGGAP